MFDLLGRQIHPTLPTMSFRPPLLTPTTTSLRQDPFLQQSRRGRWIARDGHFDGHFAFFRFPTKYLLFQPNHPRLQRFDLPALLLQLLRLLTDLGFPVLSLSFPVLLSLYRTRMLGTPVMGLLTQVNPLTIRLREGGRRRGHASTIRKRNGSVQKKTATRHTREKKGIGNQRGLPNIYEKTIKKQS
jgi:hypothetical protein